MGVARSSYYARPVASDADAGLVIEMRAIADAWECYGLSYAFPRLLCDKGAAARHPECAGQRRGTDRERIGRKGRAVV